MSVFPDKIRTAAAKALGRLEILKEEMSEPSALRNPARYRRLAREYSRLEKLKLLCDQLDRVCGELVSLEGMREEDGDLRAMVEEEASALAVKKEDLLNKIGEMLLPPDEMEERNIILEIRAGTGGEEAALFAADLARMYSRFAEKKGLKVESVNTHPSSRGGLKEVILTVTGPAAFREFKYESGVHRVQRVPVTESSGRTHTSAATVVVLPEAEEVEVEIDPHDLRIDTFCSSGPGGQSVNTTYSAIRVTHLPSGLVVNCQDQKSQRQNKLRALQVLRARLLEKIRTDQEEEMARQRKEQVKSGDRSDKIRTYNFPQNRVTDHRTNFSLHSLDRFLDGDLDEMIAKLKEWERIRRLAEFDSGEEG